MIKIGITGQSGFIGTHLYNTIGLYKVKFERISFEDAFFSDDIKLKKFVQSCDAIVHLAALNRHNNPSVLYQTNLSLVNQLIDACEVTNSKPHILFSSSIQEERDNLYGKSKKEGRELFEKWAAQNNAQFTGLILPNVYGPFGNPFYNSVVATFCHQLTHNEQPKIEVDSEIELIYVDELVAKIIEIIENVHVGQSNDLFIQQIKLQHNTKASVSSILQLLETYKSNYFEKGEIPALDILFHRNLFNTFLCYIDHATFFPFKLKLNIDQRGSFVETIKLNSGGQISFSTTVPGITRGNHFHTRKAERFVVIKGKARIDLRRIGTNKVLSFELNGKEPSFIDIPVWYTHNITNIGDEELYTIFWINEHFRAHNPDTFFELV